MGNSCNNKTSVDIVRSKPVSFPAAHIISEPVSYDQIRKKKSLLFQSEAADSTFNDISTPRNKPIKWKRGDLIGEGAYAKVYQCLNIETGELLAVKHFTVLII